MSPLIGTYGYNGILGMGGGAAFDPADHGTVMVHIAGRLDTTHSDTDTVTTIPDHGPSAHVITQSSPTFKGVFAADAAGSGLHAYRVAVDDYYTLAGGSFKTGTAIAILNSSEDPFADFNGVWTETGAADFLLVNSGGNVWRNAGKFGTNIYVNGVKTVNWDTPVSTFQSGGGFHAGTPATITNYTFATDNTSGSRSWNGDICELIVLEEVLTEAQFQALDTALRAVYGI